jgi:hypothetical protein
MTAPSEFEASGPSEVVTCTIPSELWREIATQLFSLTLCSNDFDSLLNFLATSRAATSFVRPAFCLCLQLLTAEELVEAKQKLGIDEHHELNQASNEKQQTVEQAAIERLKLGSGSFWGKILALAAHATDLSDEDLRELLYTFHIVQLQERLLYRRKGTTVVELCSNYETERARLGHIFYDVAGAERMAWVHKHVQAKRRHAARQKFDAMIDNSTTVSSQEPHEQDSSDGSAFAFTIYTRDWNILDVEVAREALEEMNARAREAKSATPLRPFLQLPGLRVTRFGCRSEALKHASEAVTRISHVLEPMKRYSFEQTLTTMEFDRTRDCELELHGFCFALLKEQGCESAREFAPEAESLLLDAIVNGVSLFMPGADHLSRFRKDALYIHKGGAATPTPEKVLCFFCIFSSHHEFC